MKLFKLLFLSIAAVFFTVLATEAQAAFNFLADNPEWIVAVNSPVIAMNNYAGKHENQLFRSLRNGMEVWADVDTNTMVKSKMNMTKLTIGKGVRPYSGLERGDNEAITLTGQVLDVELFQRDFDVEIKKFHATWQEQNLRAAEGSGANQRTIPFAEFIMNAVIEELGSELNDNTAYGGLGAAAFTQWNAGTAYTAGDAVYVDGANGRDYYVASGSSTNSAPASNPNDWDDANALAICKGFGAHIADGISASKLTPVNTGALSSTTAYAGHTEIFRAHTDAYRKNGVIHYCSYDQFYMLLDDIEEKVGKYTEKDGAWVNGRGLYLPKTNNKCLILPCSWMASTDRIVSTPKLNLIAGTDRTSDAQEIKTRDKSNYVTTSSITGTLGFTVRDFEAMRVNDQA